MATKKLVRRATIHSPLGVIQFTVGEKDVVAVTFDDYGVQIFLRAEDEKQENNTPRKMEDRPMQYYQGFPFVVTDTLE